MSVEIPHIRHSSESRGSSESVVNVCLLGATLRAENMGVNALTLCSIKAVLHRWPAAKFIIVGTRPPEPCIENVRVDGRDLAIPVYRFYWPSKQLTHPDSVLSMVVAGYAGRLSRKLGNTGLFRANGRVINALEKSDLILDTSSGDGLTEVYGARRIVFHLVRKWLITILNKRLVLMPQSFDLDSNPLVRFAASKVARNSFGIFVRDQQSLECVRRQYGASINGTPQLRLVPDLAFLLDASRPAEPADLLGAIGHPEGNLIGINVSGLLMHEPNLRKFNLRTNYHELIVALIRSFLADERNTVALVPHVVGEFFEDDARVCSKLKEQLDGEYGDRLIDLSGRYRYPGEIKYLIGCCRLLVSARMHACIAALSQNIPSVGLAYSSKFLGVFSSVGVPECVADLRTSTLPEIVNKSHLIYQKRKNISDVLSSTVPRARAQVLSMFSETKL